MTAITLAMLGCEDEPDFVPHDLSPYANEFTAADPLYSPQPRRLDPTQVVTRGGIAWVSLPGSVDEPGREVARVDLDTGALRDRVAVGSNPVGLALHPVEPVLVVLNRLSNWAAVVDEETGTLLHKQPMDYYAQGAAFSPDGSELWVSNRWRDEVQVFRWDGVEGATQVDALPVYVNPRDVAISADGDRVAVASVTGLGVTLFDRRSREEIAAIDLRAPANGIAFAGDWLVVATGSPSSNNKPFEGPDGDGDGTPGDGTPNTNFQDMQNELAVIAATTGDLAWRYTSDTICCKDFRDVDPAAGSLHGELLPPADRWIVGGALPEQVAPADGGVWVSYASSDEFQFFAVDPSTGALTPGEVYPTTGHNPTGIAAEPDGRVLVAQRLSETLGVFDTRGVSLANIEVGDLSGGLFPATDAEIGELFNSVTAPFTVDGDQSCIQCHREGGNLDKAVGMPLALYPGVNRRMVNAYRGAFGTRPWFFEGAMDQTNFRPVINEFARVENFCCEDPTLWPDGAPSDCATNPPAVCTTEPNAGSTDTFTAAREGVEVAHVRPTPFATRDQFFLDAASRVFGRTESFGDGVYNLDPVTLDRTPLALTLEGITRSLGLFLLTDTQLLPNPNDPDRDTVRRGRAIFESAQANCASCHPSPTFTTSETNNPAGLPLRMPPVVTPDYREDGINLDLISAGFLSTFPNTEQDSCEDVCSEEICAEDAAACDDLRNVYFSPPTLLGIWDRAPSMLHDGRAQGLREVLCTPGHPALQEGETGFNERDGIPDTHGGTSHLRPQDIEDLIAYLETL